MSRYPRPAVDTRAGPTLTPPSSEPRRGPRALLGRLPKVTAERGLTRVLIVLVGLLVLVPLAYLVIGAFRSGPPGAPDSGFTLENVSRVFFSGEYVRPFLNTLALGAAVSILSVFVGCALAWVVTRTDVRHAGFWENVLVIPIYLSPLMLALAGVALAAPRVGFLHVIMPWTDWLNVYSFLGMVWVLGSHYSSYVFLYMLGPMRAIDGQLEEAALVLGASRWNILRGIVAPLLGPALVSNAVIIFTLAAENFAVPSLLGRPTGFQTLPSEIYYNLAYPPTNSNVAAALALLLLILTMAGIILYRRLARHSARYVTVGGKPRPTNIFVFKRFGAVRTFVLIAWLLLAIGIPVASLVFGSLLKFISGTFDASLLTLDNYRLVFSPDGFTAIRNTAFLAVVGATLTAFLGALITYAVQRTSARGRGFLDYLSATTIAIPGMALGVGMLWAYINAPGALYGSVGILLIAYVTRFMAHGVRASGSSLLQISPHLEESAKVLGAGIAKRLQTIVFPLMRRGILSSWMLIFIFIVNELSVTILLFSPDSQTISVRVFNSVQMYGSAPAFAFATVQTVIVFVTLVIIFRLFGRVDAVAQDPFNDEKESRL